MREALVAILRAFPLTLFYRKLQKGEKMNLMPGCVWLCAGTFKINFLRY